MSEVHARPVSEDPAATESGTFRIGSRTLVVRDPYMARVVARLRDRLSRSSMPVLIQGETGTGKELIALALHEWSDRARGPFIPVNVAAIPDTLLESELFGAEEGAFSGATKARTGLVEAAHGGVLFLDEIGELAASAQAKLLRVLESKEVRRLGATAVREVDVRIVAATNRGLADEVAQGRFRRDLYFRLKGAIIRLPPLRERPAELRVLAGTLLTEACRAIGRSEVEIDADAMKRILAHKWSGNVRELESFVDWAAAVIDGPELSTHHFDEWIGSTDISEVPALRGDSAPTPTPSVFRPIAEEVAELEKMRMEEALHVSDGNRTQAAALIQMPLRTFATKLKVYGLGPREDDGG